MLIKNTTPSIFLIVLLGCSLFGPDCIVKAGNSTADASDSLKSVEEELEHLSYLLDQAQYKKVEEEWARLAPLAQQIQLEEKFSEQLAALYERKIRKGLREGEYQLALKQWEQAVASHPQLENLLGRKWNRDLIWKLPRAYIKINQTEKAIKIFTKYYQEPPIPNNYNPPEPVERRAELGELLIFGERVPPTNQKHYLMGRALCTLCHSFTKGEWEQWCPHSRCGPNLQGVIPRTKQLLVSPEYMENRKTSIQPEAFPGSGVPTTIIEYLVESQVCPSCYVVPGFLNFPDEHGKESRMPAMHRGPNNLTVEEMMAINTWLFLYSDVDVPSLHEMHAAFDKFLPTEDRPENRDALFLAALYDANRELDEALEIVEANYPEIWIKEPEKTLVGYNLRKWRNDPEMFVHLKQQPEFVKKFPLLLQPD